MAAMITTEDNPYDPRTDYLSWYRWDIGQGYFTVSYLARVAALPEDVPEVVKDFYIEAAIDEIVKLHAGGLYKKLPLEEEAA